FRSLFLPCCPSFSLSAKRSLRFGATPLSYRVFFTPRCSPPPLLCSLALHGALPLCLPALLPVFRSFREAVSLIGPTSNLMPRNFNPGVFPLSYSGGEGWGEEALNLLALVQTAFYRGGAHESNDCDCPSASPRPDRGR